MTDLEALKHVISLAEHGCRNEKDRQAIEVVRKAIWALALGESSTQTPNRVMFDRRFDQLVFLETRRAGKFGSQFTGSRELARIDAEKLKPRDFSEVCRFLAARLDR